MAEDFPLIMKRESSDAEVHGGFNFAVAPDATHVGAEAGVTFSVGPMIVQDDRYVFSNGTRFGVDVTYANITDESVKIQRLGVLGSLEKVLGRSAGFSNGGRTGLTLFTRVGPGFDLSRSDGSPTLNILADGGVQFFEIVGFTVAGVIQGAIDVKNISDLATVTAGATIKQKIYTKKVGHNDLNYSTREAGDRLPYISATDYERYGNRKVWDEYNRLSLEAENLFNELEILNEKVTKLEIETPIKPTEVKRRELEKEIEKIKAAYAVLVTDRKAKSEDKTKLETQLEWKQKELEKEIELFNYEMSKHDNYLATEFNPVVNKRDDVQDAYDAALEAAKLERENIRETHKM